MPELNIYVSAVGDKVILGDLYGEVKTKRVKNIKNIYPAIQSKINYINTVIFMVRFNSDSKATKLFHNFNKNLKGMGFKSMTLPKINPGQGLMVEYSKK